VNAGGMDKLRQGPSDSPLIPDHAKSVRGNTNTDVGSDAADVEIGDIFLSDQLFHVGCAQLLVVKKLCTPLGSYPIQEMLAHLKSLRGNTNADVSSDAADVEICLSLSLRANTNANVKICVRFKRVS